MTAPLIDVGELPVGVVSRHVLQRPDLDVAAVLSLVGVKGRLLPTHCHQAVEDGAVVSLAVLHHPDLGLAPGLEVARAVNHFVVLLLWRGETYIHDQGQGYSWGTSFVRVWGGAGI